MHELRANLSKIAGVKAVLDAVRTRSSLTVRGPQASAAAVLTAVLADELDGVALVVCPGVEYAEEFAEDVNLIAEGLACHFPAMEVLPGEEDQANEAIVKARLSVLRHLTFGTSGTGQADFLEPQAGTKLVCTSINALLQPVAGPSELRDGTRLLQVKDQTGPAQLVEWLVDSGFMGVPQVNLPGQYSLRGGILDVYSHGAEHPVRIEFFGDQVSSIRTFDAGTQLSLDRVKDCHLTAVRDPFSGSPGGAAGLTAYFAADATIILVEPEHVWERARELAETTQHEALYQDPDALQEAMASRPTISFVPEEADAAEAEIHVPCQRRDVFGIDVDGALTELERICLGYGATYLFCLSPAEEERLKRLLRDREFEQTERIRFRRGRLNHGALFLEDGLALIPHHKLFGRYRQRRLLRHAEEGRPVTDAAELNPGDLVVHVTHGIGRFRGARVLDTDGHQQEHIEIEFADNSRVYVPSDRIEMVHRYIGIGGRHPSLAKLHGVQWRVARRKVEQAVQDMAAELLRMQALRQTSPGIAFPADDDWQRQFESEFPYEETDDQLRTIDVMKEDMTADRPMDRLVCGDVGYGKTEIAMRAAFKVAVAGWQVAVLVPTTVLAQQHFRTFRERMADYPVRVEMLSRFVTPARARHVVEEMATGNVDVVIGTHRLLQKDVTFKNLGLVIIDEEQRFGVRHKERLKRMRSTVDVLTLTATPIPRTLHMSLMGLRDISSLQTPPLDRQAVETRVKQFDPNLLRQAVLRELHREGQVFLVHNRVHSIQKLAETVRDLVPEAIVEVAHGQMPEHQLSEVMTQFTDGEVDVLMSTTIIENGLDIPNANTLIIDRADLLGLAEMHQLRGRVGRYIHKAYAYFFTPRDRPVTPEAQSRLDAIRRYSSLGAGFDIALRDLELRGAGNILGPEQSGHIAAVGYNLYCRLLSRAVAALKGEDTKEPPAVTVSIGLEALLPESYVPALQQRIEVYRELGRATELEDVRRVARGLRDRFGPPPQAAQNLLTETEIRVLASKAGADSVQLQDGRVVFTLRDAERFRNYFAGAKIKPRVVRDEMAVVDARLSAAGDAAVALFVRELLAQG